MKKFLGGERTVETVGDYSGRITFAAMAGFYGTATVVEDDDVGHVGKWAKIGSGVEVWMVGFSAVHNLGFVLYWKLKE